MGSFRICLNSSTGIRVSNWSLKGKGWRLTVGVKARVLMESHSICFRRNAQSTKAVVMNRDLPQYVRFVSEDFRNNVLVCQVLSRANSGRGAVNTIRFKQMSPTYLLPKPKLSDLRSSRTAPSESSHLSGRKSSGSGKTSGDRPIDLEKTHCQNMLDRRVNEMCTSDCRSQLLQQEFCILAI